MRVKVLFGCLLGIAALAMATASTFAADKFVPQGHTYSPDDNKLPLLNSQRDRVNSTTDRYEAEMYRIERERAIIEGELTRHIQHDIYGGSEFQPRY